MSIAQYVPHGFCLSWNWDLIIPFVAANLAIAFAYLVIPFSLWWLALPIKRYKGGRVSVLQRFTFGFAAFIFLCGTGHVVKVLTIWFPIYWLETYWDILTGLASVYVAMALVVWSKYIARVIAHAPSKQKLIEAYEQSEQALKILREKLEREKTQGNQRPMT